MIDFLIISSLYLVVHFELVILIMSDIFHNFEFISHKSDFFICISFSLF